MTTLHTVPNDFFIFSFSNFWPNFKIRTKLVQVEGKSKIKLAWNFDFSETQPNLSKVSASRVKNRASRVKNEARFNFSEAQPVLSKRKVLAQFSFPRCSLTYPKLVQVEGKTAQAEWKMKFASIFPRRSRFYQKSKIKLAWNFDFSETQPNLSKVSANYFKPIFWK